MEPGFEQIIQNNRECLREIQSWIDQETYRKSVFDYGVPDFIKDLIDLEINEEPTYSDFMVQYGRKLKEPLNYLELGVSVGKNFYQVLKSFENATLTGIDIEEINPVLAAKLKPTGSVTYERMPASVKKNDFSITDYTSGNNKVRYLSADVWDENTWKKLSGSKFNFIFSDALHDPRAILFEYEMVRKYQLLDEQFIFFWDDLVGDMCESFFRIASKMKKHYNLTSDNIYLVRVNGWLGQHEAQKHDVGMIIRL